MPTVLHISASGTAWWKKSSAGWAPVSEPTQGYVGVVTDLAEETFVEITVPRVFGADRKSFIQRQLATRFPESVFRTALPPRVQGGLMERLAPPLQTLAAIDPGERIQAALQGLQVSVAGVWSTSLLLAQLGKHASMPANLFIVLCQPTGMRILFLKQRTPVLTRLITATQSAPEQAGEIVRTVRHLENTRVIEREGQRFGVLLLGAAPALAAALAEERLDEVPPPAPWNKGAAPDWSHVLMDLASKGPPGQLAPMSYRNAYLARKLVQATRVAAALCVVGGVWAASGSISTAVQAQRQRTELQAAVGATTQQVATLDQSIGVFGVSPELVRKAIAVDTEEVASAPDMEAHLLGLSRVIGHIPGARLKVLEWKVLPPSEPACTTGMAASPAGGEAAQPVEPARQVELAFTVLLDDHIGPRLRSQQALEISRQLALLKGVLVVQDPARTLRTGNISSSTGTTSTQTQEAFNLDWCITLPGLLAIQAAQAEPKP